MKTIANEKAKALMVPGTKEHKKFSNGGVRNLEMNTFAEGDVFQIPDPDAADYAVIEQPIRGSFTTNADGSKTQNVAEFVLVNVKRGSGTTIAQLFPSLFWKSRQVADAAGNATDEWRRASGTVAEEVQNFADVEEFFRANKSKEVKITGINNKFSSPRFGGNGVQKAWVPTLEWAN